MKALLHHGSRSRSQLPGEAGPGTESPYRGVAVTPGAGV
jgi:hypothetical protein